MAVPPILMIHFQNWFSSISRYNTSASAGFLPVGLHFQQIRSFFFRWESPFVKPTEMLHIPSSQKTKLQLSDALLCKQPQECCDDHWGPLGLCAQHLHILSALPWLRYQTYYHLCWWRGCGLTTNNTNSESSYWDKIMQVAVWQMSTEQRSCLFCKEEKRKDKNPN